eukprot:scaffold27456_cov32-Tisochrysis_lutea.AAC.3
MPSRPSIVLIEAARGDVFARAGTAAVLACALRPLARKLSPLVRTSRGDGRACERGGGGREHKDSGS